MQGRHPREMQQPAFLIPYRKQSAGRSSRMADISPLLVRSQGMIALTGIEWPSIYVLVGIFVKHKYTAASGGKDGVLNKYAQVGRVWDLYRS